MEGFSDSTGKGFSMLNRLSFIIAVSIVLSSQQIVGASPLTYDFTGTLNQPVDGSTTFTGSFTINANPTVWSSATVNPPDLPVMSGVFESGSDISLTVNLGGQMINYVNTPQFPGSARFSLTTWSDLMNMSPGLAGLKGPLLEFTVGGGANGGNITFGMIFESPGGVEQLSNLRGVSLPLNTSYVTVYDSSSQQGAAGSITSIEAVSVPEPSALVVSAMLGIAAMVYRHCHNS
jgi:hypothetical protein